ncbi:hypothetical protein E2L08_01925 [Palleronia sediminis]|uniref:Sulfotransferase family protein n=1 Tax=Palleronia sediminis TaxID=2547833 RepID=A0A4R6ANT6_9RHOB|nr:sulfotransferase [Palleronia sediminis]TDL84248.1 hypothetical protein E2L08_01925 [Palleronia sediminis]
MEPRVDPAGALRVMICAGATKAGTTWLFETLRGHPECHLRGVKELHFWDAGIEVSQASMLDRLGASAARKLTRIADEGDPEGRLRAELADMDAVAALHEDGATADDWLAYLSHGRGGRAVVGEASPSYALLPRERLAEMARATPGLRLIYLMRDPVARLWSNLRMVESAGRDGDDGLAARVDRAMHAVFAGKRAGVARRCDYRGALGRLDAAIPAGNLLAMTSEEAFTDAGLARICDFLGIAPVPAPPTRHHEGVALPATRQQRDAMRRFLRPQYEYIRLRFGSLPEAWLPETHGDPR